MPPRLRVATRGSRLARTQANQVLDLLRVPGELVVVATTGDLRDDVELHRMGGVGVFVREVQQAVLDGRADIAVHSAKDLPPRPTEGLELIAIPTREDPRDALVGNRLDDIPVGGVIATGAVRRQAQLAGYRPDLRFAPLRGNIETRLDKAPSFDAIVVAVAALARLGLSDHVAEILSSTVMVPQVGQGALAVECRSDDPRIRKHLGVLDDPAARSELTAERAFLAAIGGGCDMPCGAWARSADSESLMLTGMLATLDGRVVLRAERRGSDPVRLGEEMAHHLWVECGGRDLVGCTTLASAGSVTDSDVVVERPV